MSQPPEPAPRVPDFGRFRLGEWEVNQAENSLCSGDRTVRLEPRVMDVLVHLAAEPERVVSKEELLAAVWGGAFVEEGAVAQVVHSLRKALGDDARQPRYIRTIPKRGYRLVVPVELERDKSGVVVRASPDLPLESSSSLGTGSASKGRVKVRTFQAAVELIAAQFQLEEDGLLEEPREPAEAAPAAEVPAPVVPLRRGRAVPRWALPLAAMLLVGLATLPLYLHSREMPPMRSGELVDPAALAQVPLDGFWSTMRGAHGAAILDSTSFELLTGAHLVDLRLALARDDVDDSLDFLSRINVSMASLSFVDTARASFLEMHSQLATGKTMPKSLVEHLDRTETELEEALAGSAFLAVGKWSEAGRLFSVGGDPGFFEQDENRRFSAWFLRNAEEQGLDEGVIQGVQKIRDTLEDSASSSLPFPDLEKQFAAILRHYQHEAVAAADL
jgi:DNA-binding winged helix-turn-helix (wHTH) protein